VKPLERKSLLNRPHLVLAPPDLLGEHDGVSFQRERLAPILRELMRLIELDWRENGVDQERVPLELNIDQYLDYDLLGILQIVTARDKDCDGLLVGFVFAFVHPHIMHAGKGWCLVNLYYLFPEYRKRGIGKAMFEALLKFLREAQVSVVEASVKVDHEHGVFERLGFKPTDRVVRKLMEE
jgi:GNAT superfamily N-acetyltransferase